MTLVVGVDFEQFKLQRNIAQLDELYRSFNRVEAAAVKTVSELPSTQRAFEALTKDFQQGVIGADRLRAGLLSLAGSGGALPRTAEELRRTAREADGAEKALRKAADTYLRDLDRFHQHTTAMRREAEGFATFTGTLARGFGAVGVAVAAVDHVLEGAATRLAEFQRLQRVQGELGVNFARAQASTQRFVGQMDVAALAEHFASAQVNLDQRQINALTGGAARLAQMQGTSFEMQGERLFSGIVGGELEVLRRFGPEMAALSGQTHTAQERLEAFIRTSRNLGEATEDASTAVERLKESLRQGERSFLHGFEQEATRILAQDGAITRTLGGVNNLSGAMERFGATSARVIGTVADGAIRWNNTLNRVYDTLRELNPLMQAFERLGGGRFARDVRTGVQGARTMVGDAVGWIGRQLGFEEVPASGEVRVNAMPSEFGGSDQRSFGTISRPGEGTIGLGAAANAARAELVRQHGYTQSQADSLTDVMALRLAGELPGRRASRGGQQRQSRTVEITDKNQLIGQSYLGLLRSDDPEERENARNALNAFIDAPREVDSATSAYAEEKLMLNARELETGADPLRTVASIRNAASIADPLRTITAQARGGLDHSGADAEAEAERRNADSLRRAAELEHQGDLMVRLFERQHDAARFMGDAIVSAYDDGSKAAAQFLIDTAQGVEGAGDALQTFAAKRLQAIAIEAGGQALQATAEGIYYSFTAPPIAASKFLAAAKFAAIAVGGGLGTALLAPVTQGAGADAGGRGGRSRLGGGASPTRLGRSDGDSGGGPTIVNINVTSGVASTPRDTARAVRRVLGDGAALTGIGLPANVLGGM